jgi:hypothetical protein
MKAVIVETKDKMAAALSADGQVIKIKNRNYAIGQVIEAGKNQTYKTRRLVARAVAAAAVVAICSGSALAYYTPYSYVSLDVNPSFEYTLNYMDIVLSVRSLGGETILDEYELKELNNKNIRQALAETVEQIAEDGYFDEGVENGILIAVSSKNEEKADKLADSLQQSVQTERADSENIEIETSNVKKETVDEAKDLGVSAGKLGLVEDLEESVGGEEINRDEWLQKPVKEIMDEIKENKKEDKEEAKDNKKEDKEETKDNKKDDKENDKAGDKAK